MAQDSSYDLRYIVYKVAKGDPIPGFEKTDILVYIQSFQDDANAQNWIIDEGERHVNYTILPVYRKK
jgi:hypothetical protein